MTRHVVPAVVQRSPHEIAGRLCVRPAGWLKGFLLLATYPVPAEDTSAANTRTFCLGEPVQLGHSVVEVPFSWTPVSGGDLFTEFIGKFVVAPGHGTALLTLDGEATGGVDALNEAVLVTLVDLLAAAFSEATH